MILRTTLAAAFSLIVCALSPALSAETPSYVGSGACTACHADESAAWKGSHHALAWTKPTPDNVLGNFDNQSFSHGGFTARFLRDGDRYLIETEGPDGQRRPYEVLGVAGIHPLQQYLLSPVPGRTQVFDIGWDVEKRHWFPVFPGDAPPPGDGFHWTGPYKSWEARCAECHSTGYSRNYQPQARTYTPKMAEIGVGCEACHGPGSAHVTWANGPRSKDPTYSGLAGLTRFDLTVDLATSQSTEVQQCMTCHSRREAHADGNPVPGTPYDDSYALALLRQGQYYPDGAILDEVFEGGSFLQSKMFAKGVTCSNCHTPHSGELVAEGNAVCTQCHSPAGNTAFPSLPKRVFDGPEHTFHPVGSTGAQCTSCHMTQRTYMGVDERHDHSFRIPRPDLAATGSPDACSGCHADKDAAWAAEQLKTWFPDSTHRGPHFAEVFAAARAAPEGQADALLRVATGDAPGIVQATALELLAPVLRPDQVQAVADLIGDADPLVRAAAARAVQALPPDRRLTLLARALTDPVRNVRISAARALLDAQPGPQAPEVKALAAAMAEWQSSLQSRLDFPETYLQFGGIGLTTRNWDMAMQSFRTAVNLDPQLVNGWIILIRIQAALGDVQGARKTFVEAVQSNPGSQPLLAIAGEIGMGIIQPKKP